MQSSDVTSRTVTDTLARANAGNSRSVQGMAASQFMDLLSRARVEMQVGLGAMNAAAGVGRLPDHADMRAVSADRNSQRAEPVRDRSESPRNESKNSTQRESTRTDARQSQPTERQDATPAADRQEAAPETRADRTQGKPESTREKISGQKAKASDNTDAAAGAATMPTEAQPTAAPVAALAQAQAVDPNAQSLSALAAGIGNETAGQAAAAANTQAGQPLKAETNQGPIMAANPAGEVKPDAEAGQRDSFGQQWTNNGNQPQKSLADTHGQQAQNRNPGEFQQVQAAVQMAEQTPEARRQQAAQLSTMVGEGNRITVNTQVVDEASTLLSRPVQNLTGPATITAEGTTQPQTAPGSIAGSLHIDVQQMAMQATPAAQGQNQLSVAQAAQQMAASAGAEPKGMVQATGQTPLHAQNAQGLGGETQAAHNTPGQTQQTGQTQQGAQAQAAHQPRFTLPGQSVVDQVSVQIAKALQNGTDRITVQLRPEALGRIEVKMELTHDGRVMATVTADNKDTLDLLQRDARDLQKAMQEAGLQLDSGNLNFNLREGREGNGEGDGKSANGGRDVLDAFDDGDDILDATSTANYPGGISPDGRLDIRA